MPDVPLRIDAHGVRAARRASRRSIDGRVARLVGRPSALGNSRDFSFAEHPIAPRADELSAAVELNDRVGATMKDEYRPFGGHSDARGLNKIPGAANPAALLAGAGHSTSLYPDTGPLGLSWAPIVSSITPVMTRPATSKPM